MPGYLLKGLRTTAFMAISFLLLPAIAARAGEDFEAGLEEGRRHGAEILSRHSEILRPSAVESEALPGYETETQQELRQEGSRWTGNAEGMRTEAEDKIQRGDPATSDAAAGFSSETPRRDPCSP